MQNKQVTYAYCGTAIVIVLVLLLLMQVFSRNNTLSPVGPKHSILVDTPKGLISADKDQVAKQLKIMRNKIVRDTTKLDACDELKPAIDQAVNNLQQFIKNNPGAELCEATEQADKIHQAMQDSIDPDPVEWQGSYATILEWENYEHAIRKNPKERLKYLINNLDIVIRMMHTKVCQFGKLDLLKLRQIMLFMNEQICQKQDPFLKYDSNARLYTDMKKPAIMPYDYSYIQLEPFQESKETHHRSNRVDGFTGGVTDVVFADVDQEIGLNNADRSSNAFSSIYRRSEFSADQVSDYKAIALSEAREDKKNKILDLAVYNRSSKDYYNKYGSTLLDKSYEGLAERGILAHSQPLHLIRQISDHGEDHYTTRVNACLGKTVPDEDLLYQCAMPDLRAIAATDGSNNWGGGLISKLDQSYHSLVHMSRGK